MDQKGRREGRKEGIMEQTNARMSEKGKRNEGKEGKEGLSMLFRFNQRNRPVKQL